MTIGVKWPQILDLNSWWIEMKQGRNYLRSWPGFNAWNVKETIKRNENVSETLHWKVTSWFVNVCVYCTSYSAILSIWYLLFYFGPYLQCMKFWSTFEVYEVYEGFKMGGSAFSCMTSRSELKLWIMTESGPLHNLQNEYNNFKPCTVHKHVYTQTFV